MQFAVRVDSRLGFTLIELLIAIAIIATLSALFLGASRAAMESSRAARTKTTIAKLHTLIMEQWASYETRRVDLDQKVQDHINSLLENNADQLRTKSGVTRDYRLLALRELMKFELPDRWSDVDLSLRLGAKGTNSRDAAAVYLRTVPTVARTYDRRFRQALANTGNNESLVRRNESAECLYLIVMLLTADGEARTMFTAQDIGDTDGDGAPEFLDGWGNPIHFLRWPAGFVGRSAVMSGDPQGDHDPFDPFRRNATTALPVANQFPTSPFNIRNSMTHLRGGNNTLPFGFRLVPLIYSSGPDGISDIDSAAADFTADPSGDVALNPYAEEPGPNPTYQFGTPEDNPDDPDGDDNSIDNIHNHLMDNR